MPRIHACGSLESEFRANCRQTRNTFSAILLTAYYSKAISRSGCDSVGMRILSICVEDIVENLLVVSGPDMLTQTAFDAMRAWRYKLKNEPVEIEATGTHLLPAEAKGSSDFPGR